MEDLWIEDSEALTEICDDEARNVEMIGEDFLYAELTDEWTAVLVTFAEET